MISGLGRDHSFSTYAKHSEKLIFLTPWYAKIRLHNRGVRKVSFSESFAYVLYECSLISISMKYFIIGVWQDPKYTLLHVLTLHLLWFISLRIVLLQFFLILLKTCHSNRWDCKHQLEYESSITEIFKIVGIPRIWVIQISFDVPCLHKKAFLERVALFAGSRKNWYKTDLKKDKNIQISGRVSL